MLDFGAFYLTSPQLKFSPDMTADPPNENQSHWFSPGKFALLLGLLIVAAFPGILAGTQTFVIRDYGLYGYPLAWHHRQCFWQGEIPLWNPLDCCGLPFLAQYNTITLYPLSLIYLLLPMPWSLSFFCLAHQFLAGMGMYHLARRWTGSTRAAALAGIIMAFNGLTLHFLMWPNHIACFAWMPWDILTAEIAWQEGGRKTILAALAAALQILAGSPETVLFTWLILLSLATIHFVKQTVPRRTITLRFLIIGAIAGSLTAVQLLPFLDLAGHSQRGKNFASAYWAMPKLGWGNFLLPMFQGHQYDPVFYQEGQYWTTSYYAGMGAVCLAALALLRKKSWRVYFLGLALAASLILALGDNGLVYTWLKKLIPALGFFRFPIKFAIPALFIFPLLAAFAIRHLEESASDKNEKLPILLGAVLAALITGLLCFEYKYPVGPAHFDLVLKNGLARLGYLAAAIFLLHYFITRPTQRNRTTFALIAVVLLDLLTHEPWQNPGVDPSVYDPKLAATELKLNPGPAVGESRLMMSPEAMHEVFYTSLTDVKKDFLLSRISFQGNCNLLDNLPKTDGFYPLYLKEYDQVFNLTYAHASRNSVQDLMCVSQTSVPGKYFDWETRPSRLPMVTAGQKPIFADDPTTYASMVRGNTDFRHTIYLPKEAENIVSVKTETQATITVQKFHDNQVNITVEAKEPSLVLISQAYYHLWKAYVDEKPVPLWRADHAFQAVEVPAGTHNIRLAYEDRAFTLGAVCALFGLIVCGAGWITLRPKP